MSSTSVINSLDPSVLDDLYRKWNDDPTSVDEQWRIFFEGFELGHGRRSVPEGDSTLQENVRLLIDRYRSIGHLSANLDPLQDAPSLHEQLKLSTFDLSESELDREVNASAFHGLGQCTLGELHNALKQTYCQSIGIEQSHIQSSEIREWIQERIEESRGRANFSHDKKLRILTHLHQAEMLERFLHAKFLGQKRFSLEGGETCIPLLDAMIEQASRAGVQEIVLGMAHRGRLNVLANVLGMPYVDLFNEFEENWVPDAFDGDGDVKYHVGFSADRTCSNGETMHLTLTPNPSHVEAVNPVVEGRTRAKQERFGDTQRRKGMPVLIHGDAAFAGQGMVAETLNLSQLTGFRTGGTIHLIINNQIGFTTGPRDARSTTYCTDVAKMIQAPIFHVNGDDPEAAVFLAELAVDFRQKFQRDVVIDLYCFRRHGHNETDEPAYTQPLLYDTIESHPSAREIYVEKLNEEGSLSREETDDVGEDFQSRLKQAFEEVKTGPARKAADRGHGGTWGHLSPKWSDELVETGVERSVLEKVVQTLGEFPDDFTPHRKIERQINQRLEKFEKNEPIAWGLAETLAFGTLLLEGTEVRLTGQDSRRGPFSHRHAVLMDSETGKAYCPLRHLDENQGRFFVYDSPLSEVSVLGFELGYSFDSPDALVLWEAQFGDFANGAQVIVDQFISCCYSKWQRDSGLVMLLPHGYEGQGPEHSSARVERYLQLCAEHNLQVCYPSTPAQYFHLLRRQVRRNFRKPLIILTPKSLLRSRSCTSETSDLTEGHFQEMIPPEGKPENVRRLILCSGKIYYDLLESDLDREGVAIARLEQFYPFPEKQIRSLLEDYQSAEEILWVQEESANMGAWRFVEPRLRGLGANPLYVGRDASASPATGIREVHLREQKTIVETALKGNAPRHVRSMTTSEDDSGEKD